MSYNEGAKKELHLHSLKFSPLGTHWLVEIINLIVNGGDPSKMERSHMVTGLELSIADMVNPDAITRETPPGYKLIDSWESPRVIPTHLDQRIFPPDAWKKKAKVILKRKTIKHVNTQPKHFL